MEILRCAAAYIIALALHEASHLVTARLLGLRIRAVRLTPFGICADIAGFCAISAAREAFTYATGPLVNIAAALLLLAFGNTGALFLANAALAAVNLLPALPLDGGRMIQTLLCSRLPPAAATRALAVSGVALGCALTAAAIILRLNATFLLFAALLCGSNIMQIKKGGFPASAVVRKAVASHSLSMHNS